MFWIGVVPPTAEAVFADFCDDFLGLSPPINEDCFSILIEDAGKLSRFCFERDHGTQLVCVKPYSVRFEKKYSRNF